MFVKIQLVVNMDPNEFDINIVIYFSIINTIFKSDLVSKPKASIWNLDGLAFMQLVLNQSIILTVSDSSASCKPKTICSMS